MPRISDHSSKRLRTLLSVCVARQEGRGADNWWYCALRRGLVALSAWPPYRIVVVGVFDELHGALVSLGSNGVISWGRGWTNICAAGRDVS